MTTPHRIYNHEHARKASERKKGLGPRIDKGLLSSIRQSYIHGQGQDVGNAKNEKRSSIQQGGSSLFLVVTMVFIQMYPGGPFLSFSPILSLPYPFFFHPLFLSTFIISSITQTHIRTHLHAYTYFCALCLPLQAKAGRDSDNRER
ncbi:MAG: hypothetical protein JOS17DRAFT_765274 [Linnemannia elongata]|nr:MAG: hypothetical protein JOS17DRAFT_765274 [Linnemannia elongata]